MHILHKTAAEAFDHLQTGLSGLEDKVYVAVLGGHIPGDECLSRIIFGYGINIDAALFVVQIHIGQKRTHASVLELELIDSQRGLGFRLSECTGDERFARDCTVEIHRVKVEQILQVGHVNIVQVYEKGI